MQDDEKKFYSDLYKIFADENTCKLINKFAQKEFDKHMYCNRNKRDEYGYGYGNGSMDAWKTIMDMKAYLTTVLRNM